jgi:hypothetical protein
MTTKVKPILPKTSDNLYEYKLAYYQLNKDEVKERNKKSMNDRYANDAEYREKKKEQMRLKGREKSTDPEYKRMLKEKREQKIANDPEYRDKLKASVSKYYANLSEEDREKRNQKLRIKYMMDKIKSLNNISNITSSNTS